MLKMVAASSFEMLATVYKQAQCCIPEDYNICCCVVVVEVFRQDLSHKICCRLLFHLKIKIKKYRL
jgi:hypothetical protein